MSHAPVISALLSLIFITSVIEKTQRNPLPHAPADCYNNCSWRTIHLFLHQDHSGKELVRLNWSNRDLCFLPSTPSFISRTSRELVESPSSRESLPNKLPAMVNGNNTSSPVYNAHGDGAQDQI